MSYLDDERRRYQRHDDEAAAVRREELIKVELSFQSTYLEAYERAAELKEQLSGGLGGELTTLLESCSDADPKATTRLVEYAHGELSKVADRLMGSARDSLAIIDARLKRLRGF